MKTLSHWIAGGAVQASGGRGPACPLGSSGTEKKDQRQMGALNG